jgi:hypothetical protein
MYPNLNPVFGRPFHRAIKVWINHSGENFIGAEPNKIGDSAGLAELVKLGIGKGGITSKPEQLEM